LNYEKTDTLELGDIKLYMIDAPKSKQKIRVETESAEPIDVDVALEGDAAAVKAFIERGRTLPGGKGEMPNRLAEKQAANRASLEAEVPAGKSFTVLLSGAKKKTDVKLKVNSI